MRRHIALFAVVAAVLALAVPVAFAGKNPPPPPSDSSINLVGTASYAGQATFDAVDPPTKWTPEVSVNCYQNGQPVYLDVQPVTGSSPYHPQFTLWSQPWASNGGGSADCTADFYYYVWQGNKETGKVDLGQTDFTATG